MIKCKCGYENEGGLFCSNCGQKLELMCPTCGAILAAGTKFCSNCGTGLNAQSTKVGGEGNVIAGDVTGSYNTNYHTSVVNNVSNVNNVYNQIVEEDAFCSICQKRIPASAKRTFICVGCGKYFCESHMDIATRKCSTCATQEANSKFDRYKAELKMQMYDSALSYFKSAMNDPSADPDVYYYAAIASLHGGNAFSQTRATIDTAINYINQAIQCEPKGIYYYFLAYIKYDYHERKYFRTKPNYKEAFSSALSHGVTRKEVDEMYALMRVPKPSCL